MDGILLINKEQNMTSHDVVARLRRICVWRLITGVIVFFSFLGNRTDSFLCT